MFRISKIRQPHCLASAKKPLTSFSHCCVVYDASRAAPVGQTFLRLAHCATRPQAALADLNPEDPHKPKNLYSEAIFTSLGTPQEMNNPTSNSKP